MSAPARTRHDLRVLLVEDDEGLAGLFADALHRASYRVTCVTTAEEALAESEYDILVTDEELGSRIRGIDLLELLCARNSPAPFIVISGHHDLDHCRRAMRLGAVDFLAKPFDLSDLVDAVRVAAERITTSSRVGVFARVYPRDEELADRSLRELGAFLMERGLGPAHRTRIASAAAQVLEYLRGEGCFGAAALDAEVDDHHVTMDIAAAVDREHDLPEHRAMIERARALAEDLELRKLPGRRSVSLAFELAPVGFEEDALDLADADYLRPHTIDSLIDVLCSGRCDESHLVPSTMAPTVGRLLSHSRQNAAAEVPQWS